MTLPTLGMESREEREERNSRKLDHHNYRFRWAVDIASWNPSEEEFDFLCTELLNEEEGKGCRQFRFEDDRKRALVSKIMQRLAGALVMEGIEGRRKMEGSGNGYIKSMDGNGCMDLKRVEIGKTKGRKPYLVKPGDGTEVVPNFNYSVSHEGKYVVLASETHCLCGCDVSSVHSFNKRRAATILTPQQQLDYALDTLKAFEKQMTPREWKDILHEHIECVETRVACIQDVFCKYWSLKEAFVKATGMGLGYDLGNIEFYINHKENRAQVSIEGQSPSDEWMFYMHKIGDGHWVSVGRGPIHAVVDAHGGFKKTFKMPEMDHDEILEHVHGSAEPPFVVMMIADLVPAHLRQAFVDVGGEVL